MGDAPGGNGPDDAVPGSAPWERPQDWTPRPAEPTRVDDLLSRLSADDEVGRRSRRRAAGDDENTVSATDLIAALQASGSTETADAEPESSVSSEATPTPPGDAEATALIARAAPVERRRGTEGEPSPSHPTPNRPSRSTLPTPRTRTAPRRPCCCRATPRTPAPSSPSLNLQAAGDDGPPAEPPTPVDPPPTGDGDQPHRTRRGFLYAGRSLVAALAALLMLFTGVEYSVLKATDDGLAKNEVTALNTNDPNIRSATATDERHPPGGSRSHHGRRPGKGVPGGEHPAARLGHQGQWQRRRQRRQRERNRTPRSPTPCCIAHISADRQHVTLVSIPRDLRVDAPLCKTWDYKTGKLSDQDYPISEGEKWKITNAYAVGGPACTVKAVQQLTGMRIDRVIGIDFVGFKAMVDALGGIQVNVCKPIIDAELDTVIANRRGADAASATRR